jgi:gas vesicle protein GvpO
VAESKSKSKSNRSSGSSSKSRSSSRNGTPSAREVVVQALEQAADLIARPIEAVTGVAKNGSEWTVTLEVVEMERIPNTTDVLGTYEVTVDRRGELTGVQRTRRYPRGASGEE